MRHFFILLFFVLPFLCKAGQKQEGQVSPKKFYETLSFTDGPWMVISGISVNGSKSTYRFILDTGSTNSSLSEELCEGFGIKTVGTDSVSDGTKKYAVNYGLADINMGGVDFRNFRVDVTDLSYLNNFECNIDGIIGLNLMKLCSWKITRDSIVITDDIRNFNRENYQQLKFDVEYNPYIRIELERNYQGSMLFDLGDNTFLSFNNESAKYIRKDKKIKGQGVYYSTAYGNQLIDTVEIFKPSGDLLFCKSGFKIADVVTKVNYDMEGDDVIGSEILDYFNLLIDFRKEKLYAQQICDEYKDKTFSSFGFNCMIENNSVRVSFVWDNSPAKENGIQLGDEITGINRLNFEGVGSKPSCETYAAIRKEMKKETVTLSLKDKNGKYFTCELQKQGLMK